MAPAISMSFLYCDASDVSMLLSDEGSVGRLDDDGSDDNDAAETAYLTKAIRWATARVNLFLLAKYPAADLSRSWIVNQWAAIIAAYNVSCRRGNPAAASLKALYEEAMEDLKLLRSGEIQLPDTAMRSAGWPAWSNVSVNILYQVRKVRVQRPISESRSGPPNYPQNADRAAEIIAPYETF